MNAPGAWIRPSASRSRISASTPAISSVRISTLGWNAQQKRPSRSASRSRCSCAIRTVMSRPMSISNSAAPPFEPPLMRYIAVSAARRSVS